MTLQKLFTEASVSIADTCLVLVTPEPDNTDLHALLTGPRRDKVHPIATPDELLTHRLGMPGDTKQTFALTVPNGANGGRDVAAVVYTHLSRRAMTNGETDERALPGNVADILNTPAGPATAEPNTIIFYSISSFVPRAGKNLLNGLLNIVRTSPQDVTTATLSPLRSLKDWMLDVSSGRYGHAPLADDHAMRHIALKCLLDNHNDVQRFHMGNGAYVGDINLRANTPDSKDGWHGLQVMVNYVYPRDPQEQAYNKSCYLHKDGPTLRMATHLRDMLDGYERCLTEPATRSNVVELNRYRPQTPAPGLVAAKPGA